MRSLSSVCRRREKRECESQRSRATMSLLTNGFSSSTDSNRFPTRLRFWTLGHWLRILLVSDSLLSLLSPSNSCRMGIARFNIKRLVTHTYQLLYTSELIRNRIIRSVFRKYIYKERDVYYALKFKLCVPKQKDKQQFLGRAKLSPRPSVLALNSLLAAYRRESGEFGQTVERIEAAVDEREGGEGLKPFGQALDFGALNALNL